MGERPLSDCSFLECLKQFLACAETHVQLPEDAMDCFSRTSPEIQIRIQAWYRALWQEVCGSSAGYPKQPVYITPVLEDELLAILSQVPETAAWPRRVTRPTLCLTHDIDYLAPTLQMNLKRCVADRAFRWSPRGTEYLSSLETLLRLDSAVSGGTPSTLFIACPQPVKSMKRRMTQWLIDPAYRPTDPLFQALKTLIDRFDCEVGLHGSYFSLSENLLSDERKSLLQALNRPISTGRQHWLNLPELPDAEALNRIRASELLVDSTLGWNGTVGFRGGFARPFPLLLSAGVLWEVPLLLMDGPLFQEMSLETDAVVETAIGLLEQVYTRQGCVALNWHERAAHSDYGWGEAYEKILAWAYAKDFSFASLTAVTQPSSFKFSAALAAASSV